MTHRAMGTGYVLLLLLLLIPTGMHAQQCDLGLLEKLQLGMQRTDFESIIGSEPCGFVRLPDRGGHYREDLENLSAPSAFRIDQIEYRCYADRDTNEVWMIALSEHLGKEYAERVPVHMRSVIDALTTRLGTPTDIQPDGVIDRIPAPSPTGMGYFKATSYATWKMADRVIRAYLFSRDDGWEIEVRVNEPVNRRG